MHARPQPPQKHFGEQLQELASPCFCGNMQVLVGVLSTELLERDNLLFQLAQSDLHSIKVDRFPLRGVFHLKIDRHARVVGSDCSVFDHASRKHAVLDGCVFVRGRVLSLQSTARTSPAPGGSTDSPPPCAICPLPGHIHSSFTRSPRLIKSSCCNEKEEKNSRATTKKAPKKIVRTFKKSKDRHTEAVQERERKREVERDATRTSRHTTPRHHDDGHGTQHTSRQKKKTERNLLQTRGMNLFHSPSQIHRTHSQYDPPRAFTRPLPVTVGTAKLVLQLEGADIL